MNMIGFGNIAFSMLSVLLGLAFRILFVFAVYYNAESRGSDKTSNYVGFSIFFPVITGIVCLFNQKNFKDKKMLKNSILLFVLSLLMFAGSCLSFSLIDNDRYFDAKGNGYVYAFEVVFYDRDGNTYRYDFDKSGYDALYKNGTDEFLDSDLCYVDTDGMLYYDKEMNIVAKDRTCCVDKNGNVFYPANYVDFNKDGTISYDYKLLHYDALGNAYTYKNIPYFDDDGNKYCYSFDSDTLKGSYTNLATGESFDNDYSFVDENGYLVYDSKQEFVKQENAEYSSQYKDSEGKIYYWASSVTWDENGKMHDSYDKVIQ